MSLSDPKSYRDVVRAVYPKATQDEAEYLLWNETAFPFAGMDEAAVHHYRFQLAEAKSVRDAGFEACELCGQIATVTDKRGDLTWCYSCYVTIREPGTPA